jgi:hypothetical protein
MAYRMMKMAYSKSRMADGRIYKLIRLMRGDFWGKNNEVGNRLRERSDMDTFTPFSPELVCPFCDGFH